ncbi:hypothetical protein [Pseudactinotalea sp. Z1748]|uniref:hypothetical protein n=1 Tax=Pseudactinotalea sp. Z1748 TaxID=3413027 RepID=UPI003C7D18B4
MSYCRWSTDDFHCDIYAYPSREGITIHVAARRAHFTAPLPDPVPLTPATAFEWAERNATVSAMLHEAEREWIDLPHAGRTITEPGPAQAAQRLRELADLGYRVPQGAIQALDEEATLEAAE